MNRSCSKDDLPLFLLLRAVYISFILLFMLCSVHMHQSKVASIIFRSGKSVHLRLCLIIKVKANDNTPLFINILSLLISDRLST